MKEYNQKTFDLALKTFLLLSPIFFFKTYILSFAQGMFFIFATFVLFGIGLTLKPKRKFSNSWLALFLLWAFVRTIIGNNFGDIAQEWFNFWLSSSSFIYILAGVLLFYTVYCYASDPKDYLKPILIVCLMNFVLVNAQITGHDFMWKHAPSICGFMGISSQLGQYSAMAIPALIYINPPLIFIPMMTLFSAKSISSILAMAIGIVFYGITLIIRKKAYRKQRIVVLTIFVIFHLIYGFIHQDYIAQKWRCRPIMWEKTLRATLKKPYIGGGYRSFTNVVVQSGAITAIGAKEFSRAHCDPLHTAQEMGIPATIFIGGFFVSLWKKFKEKKNKDALTYLLATSILIALVNMCGQTFARYANVMSTFIVLLAFLNIKCES